MSYISEIEYLQAQEFTGLDIGLPRFNKYLNSINKGLIYLIGGRLGSGKSTLAMYIVVMSYLNNTSSVLKFIYYSYELSPKVIKAKLISLLLFVLSNGAVRIKATKILKFGGDFLTGEEKKSIDVYKDEIDKFLMCIKIMERDNPTGVYKYLKSIGSHCYTSHKEDESNQYSKIIYTIKPEYKTHHYIVISDHEGIQPRERGFNIYENMSKMSEYRVHLRNDYDFFTFIPLQQLNKGITDVDRQKLKGDIIRPQEQDFRDCEVTLQDSDVVLACFNPVKLDIVKYLDYNIGRINNKFRSIHLIKNRYGVSDIDLGCLFLGDVGYWRELPETMEEKEYKQIDVL